MNFRWNFLVQMWPLVFLFGAADIQGANLDFIPVTSGAVAPNSMETADDYIIGPQDLLEVQVFQAEDYKVSTRVSEQGYVSLPLIARVHVSGLTVDQLEDVLEARLGQDYFQDPQVTVFVKEFTSQRVTVEGSVIKPGVYPLKGRTTLLQAIAMAEGVSDLADHSNVQIYRVGDKEKATEVHDLEKIRAGEAVDPVVNGEDVIVIHRSEAKSFVKNITDTLRGFVSFGTVRP